MILLSFKVPAIEIIAHAFPKPNKWKINSHAIVGREKIKIIRWIEQRLKEKAHAI